MVAVNAKRCWRYDRASAICPCLLRPLPPAHVGGGQREEKMFMLESERWGGGAGVREEFEEKEETPAPEQSSVRGGAEDEMTAEHERIVLR